MRRDRVTRPARAPPARRRDYLVATCPLPAGAEMPVPVPQPFPHRVGAHLQIAREAGDLTGEHQDRTARLGTGLHPTCRARAHLHLRPEQHDVETVDHRRQDLPPRAVVEQQAR